MTHRYPYWALIVFPAALAAPVAWGPAALVAAGLAVTMFRLVRGIAGRRAAGAAPADAITLGVDSRGRPLSISEREPSAHGLILGASGAGKTTTMLRILTQQINRGQGVVAIDMKGSPEFARALGEAAALGGRSFSVWTPDGPSYWNPLQHGNATELKDKLIATERFTEPHYQRAAERYVQRVLQALELAHPERSPTLEEVVRLMDPRRLPAAMRGLPREFVSSVQDYLAGLTPDQESAIRGLQTRLAIVTESHTGTYLQGAGSLSGAGAIDVRQALAGDDVVLFSLNSSTYGKLAAQLGTLVVQDLVCATGHRLRERAAGLQLGQATIAIDEFSGLGGDHVVALFERCRDAGVGVLTATQEMADLDRAAPGLRDQVLGNTALKLAHRQDVPTSAQTIAQIAGTEKRWEVTERTGGSIFAAYRNGGGTRRLGEQFIVHPNEIKTLEPGEAVLISKLRGAPAQTVRVTPPQRGGLAGPERGRDRPELG